MGRHAAPATEALADELCDVLHAATEPLAVWQLADLLPHRAVLHGSERALCWSTRADCPSLDHPRRPRADQRGVGYVIHPGPVLRRPTTAQVRNALYLLIRRDAARCVNGRVGYGPGREILLFVGGWPTVAEVMADDEAEVVAQGR